MGLRRDLALGLIERHPEEAAAVLESLGPDSAAGFYAGLAVDVAARILARTTAHPATAILVRLEPGVAAGIVARLPIDVAAGYLRRLDPGVLEPILGALSPRRARSCRSLLRFREDSAGALMDPEVLALPFDLVVRDAVERVRKSAEHARYNLYVVDRDDRLVGVLNLRELLLAKPRQTLGAIMHTGVIHIPAAASLRTLVEHPGWQEVHALPVVDEAGTYLGAVRYRTLRSLEARLRATGHEAGETAQALGDLFSAGLSGAIEALAAAAPRSQHGRE